MESLAMSCQIRIRVSDQYMIISGNIGVCLMNPGSLLALESAVICSGTLSKLSNSDLFKCV